MTDRQKWTVYPLLFLALGALLKDKLGFPIPRLTCRELEIVGADGTRHMLLDSDGIACRQLEIVDGNGRPQILLGSRRGSGVLEILGPRQQPLVLLGPDVQGKRGTIGTYDADGRPQLGMGVQGSTVALLLYDPLQNNVVALARDANGRGTVQTGPMPQIRIVPIHPGGAPKGEASPKEQPPSEQPAEEDESKP